MAAYNAGPFDRHVCAPNTRESVLGNLINWATNEMEKSIYWLDGMAGTGKTTIAYSFCEELRKYGIFGGSYFCSRSIEETRDPTLIIPTLATDLARQCPDSRLSDQLLLVINQDPDIRYKNLATQFEELLLNPMTDLSTSSEEPRRVLVCDAFDEAKNQKEAGNLLSVFIRYASILPFKVFFSCRPEALLIKELSDRTTFPHLHIVHLHDLEKGCVEADILQYIIAQFKLMSQRADAPDEWPSPEHIHLVADRSGTLFIYASTVCSFLASAPYGCMEERLTEIISLSYSTQSPNPVDASLDGLYAGILDQALTADGASITLDVIRIIIAVEDPLSAGGIAQLMKLSRYKVLEALSSVHSLFSVPDVDLSLPISGLHISLRDFLYDAHRSKPEYHINPTDSAKLLLRMCFDTLETALTTDRSLQYSPPLPSGLARDSDLISEALRYSCIHWITHLLQCPHFAEFDRHVANFFDNLILRWIECMSYVRKLDVAVGLLRAMEIWEQVRKVFHKVFHANVASRHQPEYAFSVSTPVGASFKLSKL